MRVLLVNNFVRHGSGVDRMVRLEQAFLSAHGHEVAARLSGGPFDVVHVHNTVSLDTTATAQRVRALWDDRPARDAMRRAARTAFEERFCTDVFGRNLVTALEQLGRSRP